MAALMKILFLDYLIFTFHPTLNSGSVCLASSALVSDIPESSDSASNKGQNISTILDNFHEVFLNAQRNYNVRLRYKFTYKNLAPVPSFERSLSDSRLGLVAIQAHSVHRCYYFEEL